MPPRRFDLYIDGVRLPSYLLSDADTQLGVRNDFFFVGRVQRFFDDETDDPDPFDPRVPPDEWFAPGVGPYQTAVFHPGFAALGRVLSFRLRRSQQGSAVRLGHGEFANHGVLRWRQLGDPAFREVRDGWWELAWDTPYVFCAAAGLHTQMTVEVRRSGGAAPSPRRRSGGAAPSPLLPRSRHG